jgi:bifunctional UDP-N-acetylglucosamine pyrophosphorylase/glucosamine-1-phosphate N-acetyltransferase
MVKNMKLFQKNISKQTVLKKPVKISKKSVLKEANIIKKNTRILDESHITNCQINEGTTIVSSYLENSTIGKNVKVGPYAKIRQNTIIKDDCRIGNFVEIKQSVIGKGTKIAHLAYIGNAEIGENCNIGAGVVFANYDGKNKNNTKVGNNCFIGSNSTIIAPIIVGDNCFIAAGSVVTESVSDGTLVIGRARQVNKEGRAKEYLKTKEKEL